MFEIFKIWMVLRKAKKEGHKAEDVILHLNLHGSFGAMGAESGGDIARVAKELHPTALLIFPLYRGCAVVPKQDYTGSLDVILYHDPCWMGHNEATIDNLPGFRMELNIHGQRSGQDFTLNGTELDTETMTLWREYRDIAADAAWEMVREKDPEARSMVMAELDQDELQKRTIKHFLLRMTRHDGRFTKDHECPKCKKNLYLRTNENFETGKYEGQSWACFECDYERKLEKDEWPIKEEKQCIDLA